MEFESSLNNIFDETFARLPYSISFVLKVRSSGNCLNTSPNFFLTFLRHSFNIGQTNVGKSGK